MIQLLTYVVGFALAAQAFIGLGYLVSSIWEKEKRASWFGALQFVGMLMVLLIYIMLASSGYFTTPRGAALLIVISTLAAGAAYFFMRRTSPNERALKGAQGHVVSGVKRYDERKVVFARNHLIPGSSEYERFYNEYPDLRERDEERRKRGHVLGKYGFVDTPHEKANVAIMLAMRYFCANTCKPEHLEPSQAPYLNGHRESMTPNEAAIKVKGIAKHLGACMVGITRIDSRWVYSHRGTIWKRKYDHGDTDWSKWGREIELEYPYAIVVAEEMDRELVDSAPHTPVFIESIYNYSKGAYITTQLAAAIANMGYRAKAQHIQEYDVLLPPLAQDAGLGEVSRMGYLLTKKYGPRVRLSAVLTDWPMQVDKPRDIGVENFCSICKKCATCCPSKSISEDRHPSEHNGSIRWKINGDTCFKYWGKVGTDCCICMKVCPWAHARTWPHKIIVWLISRNKYAGMLFSYMDDIFYGRKPKPKAPPVWAVFRKTTDDRQRKPVASTTASGQD